VRGYFFLFVILITSTLGQPESWMS